MSEYVEKFNRYFIFCSLNNSVHEPMSSGGDTSGYIEYTAIYDFDSRNPDELPFKAGDIIMVSTILTFADLNFKALYFLVMTVRFLRTASFI